MSGTTRSPFTITIGSLGVLMLAIAACEPSGLEDPRGVAERGASSVHDSSGVSIIVNHAPKWSGEHGWQVSREPAISVGGLSGSAGHLIWRAAAAARMEDGSFAILARGPGQLLIVDRQGSLVRAIGRPGQGPGDLTEPWHLQYSAGDSLVFWDKDFGPVSSFDRDGDLIDWRRIDLERALVPLRFGGGASVVAPLPDGSFVGGAGVRAHGAGPYHAPPGVVHRGSAAVVRVRADYTADTLGVYGSQGVVRVEVAPGEPAQTFPQLFPTQWSVAWDDDPLSIYLSNGDPDGIRVFSEEGDLKRIIRVDADPLPVTQEDRSEMMTWIAEQNSTTPEGRAAWNGILAQLPEQEGHPPMTALIVDRTGHLWARDRQGRFDSEWSVFDPSGRWLGRMRLPLTALYDIGSDFILGLAQDSLMVEYIREHRLVR